MSQFSIMRGAPILAGAFLVLTCGASARAPTSLKLDRVVILMRHGIRAPLDGEVPDGTRTASPWPGWPVAQSRLTDRGAQAMAILGRFDRRMLTEKGLFSAGACPDPRQVRIWANTSTRTIASGEAFARGFAPGCSLTVGHQRETEVDPIFEPLRAGATDFDARAAVTAIQRYTGGVNALARRHAATIRLLDRVLGCAGTTGCSPAGPSRVTPSADGREVSLAGPIRTTSGTAQVLLLQYAEGFPGNQVGWGRADAATIRRLGALHAALFDVFTRSPYMAAHQSAVFGRTILAALTAADSPRLTLLVGHDTNVTALAAALHIDLAAPGYATNDVAPGGALVMERLRNPASNARYVRVSYQAQPLDGLRTLSPAVTLTPLRIPGCDATLCPIETFDRILRSRLADTTRRNSSLGEQAITPQP